MITFFLWVLAPIFISAWGYYVSNDIKIQSQQLDKKNIDLKNGLNNLALREKDFETKYAAGKKEFAERDIEHSKYYQRAFDLKQEANKIQEQSRHHVNLLKQQIIKLQTELSNARQKSKRLAEKLKKLV